jgi:predicted nucleotidyltransferase
MAIVDPVLIRFRAALDRVYGDRVERVVLFGSRAWRCAPGFRL